MANTDHNKAAELHENAAKSHRAAAEQHGKGDHAKSMEHSKSAQQHSQSANKQSDQAHAKSQQQKIAGIKARLIAGPFSIAGHHCHITILTWEHLLEPIQIENVALGRRAS
jgi:hypothetical protein